MCQDRCWGDELTLSAAAEALQCEVHVVTTEQENWLLHYGAEEAAERGLRRQCFLTYVSPIHYNALVDYVDIPNKS